MHSTMQFCQIQNTFIYYHAEYNSIECTEEHFKNYIQIVICCYTFEEFEQFFFLLPGSVKDLSVNIFYAAYEETRHSNLTMKEKTNNYIQEGNKLISSSI